MRQADPSDARVVVMDIDGTLAGPPTDGDYMLCAPIPDAVERLRDLHAGGWRIILSTARGMRSRRGDVDAIRHEVLPTLVDWLAHHRVPYDELHIGKPWPGHVGYYVDDRAIRPSEFVSMNDDQIAELLNNEADRHPRQ